MNKRDEVEQHRQSTMKKDKKSSKNESRFKFKFRKFYQWIIPLNRFYFISTIILSIICT